MTPDRWRRIEELYHSAQEQPADARDAFLRNACQGDEGMLREVLSILNGPTANVAFLERSAVPVMRGRWAPGFELGHYRIDSSIGQGGMGQVFRATDTRLNRSVAIKTSLSDFDPRFQREARAIAILNHPNICTLFDVGPNFLVMELCEGETLAERIKRGALTLPETLKTGSQIAAALAAAHAKGIVHRDLKPANIVLTRLGAKVLDFGLAKSTTDELTLTASHVIMGTPFYMAPEQREGRSCDARTDIYALGLVLAEMATGKRGSQENLKGDFANLVERCLAADPEERWQAAADIRAQLDWLRNRPAVTEPRRRALPVAAWVAGGLVLAAAVFAAARYTAPAANSGRGAPLPSQFALAVDAIAQSTGFESVPQPSPDGRFFAYTGQDASGHRAVWLRPVAAARSVPIPGTENADNPFWSPDSRWIGFFADGKVKKVSPDGGTPQSIAALTSQFQEPTWGSRGDIIFRPSNRESLFRISESGGAPVKITTLDRGRTENSHRGQQFLPDGRHFIFVARCAERAMNALYLGSLDTGKTSRIMQIDSSVRYIAPQANGKGHGLILYHRDGALVARRLDPDRERVEGEPVTVLDQIGFNPTGLGLDFRSSADGRLAVLRSISVQLSTTTWYSRSGLRQAIVGEPDNRQQVRLSPDGSRVAYAGVDPQTSNRDVFTMEIARPIAVRQTTNVANDWFPVWSPGGKDLAFTSDRPNGGMFLKPATDNEAPEIRINSLWPEDWSRDGKWIAGTDDNILRVSKPDPGSVPVDLLPRSKAYANGIRFSPDSRWISYVSDETGRSQVYVRPFQGAAHAGPAIQISREGGDFAVWNPLGGELFFVSGDLTLWSVATRDFGRAPVPEPARLFRLCESSSTITVPFNRASYVTPYDTLDGKRFLVNCNVQPPNRFTVLMNWKFPE